jgi:enamine deaminase RidA (YjgF/YER057c/UK114 family)
VTIKTYQPAERKPARGYSEVSSGGGIIAVSGQLPADEVLARGGTFAEQYQSALSRFTEALSAAGAQPADILRLNIFVTDIEEYRSTAREVGPAYREILKAPPYPAVTLVAVSGLVDARAKVEIDGLAVLNGNG